MAVKCVGYQLKVGSFENDKGKDVNYDNVILYTVSDEKIPGVIGMTSSQVKFTREKFDEVTKLGDKTLENIVDSEILICTSIIEGKPVITGII